MKGLIEWTELNISRGRKIVLFVTVIVFLIITIAVFTAAIYGVDMTNSIDSLYVTLVGLMISVYGFYTGTAPKPTKKSEDGYDVD